MIHDTRYSIVNVLLYMFLDLFSILYYSRSIIDVIFQMFYYSFGICSILVVRDVLF